MGGSDYVPESYDGDWHMKISVRLQDRSYNIVVKESFAGLGQAIRRLGLPSSGWIVTHHRLWRQYGRSLQAALRRGGWRGEVITIPESERSKSFAMVQRVVGTLTRKPSMRTPLLIAFGGGVVGDLTGFVASVYRRGVPYVQVPSTLLAQVDSAIGGKTGVDLPRAKNFVGAIYQPRLVWNHTQLLQSLPLRQRRSGLGEIIKYGVMGDAALFRYLEQHLEDCLRLNRSAVTRMVERSCRIKARVVSQDERETKGIRHQLNFGHTLGHALEAVTQYRRWTHGEAIAIGMCAATALAVETGRCSQSLLDRITDLIEASGLPTKATGMSVRAVLQAARYDKKFTQGTQRWVLPTQLGKVVVADEVSPRVIQAVMKRYVVRGTR